MRSYNYVAEIPVIRPSKFGITKVKAGAMTLVEKHGVGNCVASLDWDGNVRFDKSPADGLWLKYISATARGRWEAKGWNFDSGTTAQVYMNYLGGVGGGWGGQVVFVKDGKEIGFRSIMGGRKLFSYYKDMAKLGIYIP